MTLDGKIAAADGASRWITGEAARLEAHRLRFAADAVLVGIGTVLADDPRLTVRHPGLPPKEPFRVVADSRLRIRRTAQVLRAGDPEPGGRRVRRSGPGRRRRRRFRARGARVLELPGRRRTRGSSARCSTPCGQLDVIAVLVEGGGELGGALAEARLVDRVAFFVAPRLVGGRDAPGPVGGRGRALKDALALVDVGPAGWATIC